MNVKIQQVEQNCWTLTDERGRILDVSATPMPLVAAYISGLNSPITIVIEIEKRSVWRGLREFMRRNRDDLMIMLMGGTMALGLFVLLARGG